MTHTELFHTYLRHYADKNLEAISGVLADEVHLRDWNISLCGKEEAIVPRNPHRRLIEPTPKLNTPLNTNGRCANLMVKKIIVLLSREVDQATEIDP